ncbi:MAG: hypothetical protein IPF92_12760 [Myxococcales bacterium]|nr:hypothetical protein [Myxococcales bacterium]MBL0197382.1 hypothetical protein [Myxococcales bacterium]HQY62681.1 hypothetical protein [Polyangiaceae bacterium]
MRDHRRPATRALGVLAALAVGAALCVATPARADVQSDIEKGRAAYVAKNYAEAEPHFRRALDPAETSRDPSQTSVSRMFLGAIAVARGRREDAGKLFETLLLDDQLYEPDPLSFPTDVINLFIDTRAQLRERLNAAAAERARQEAARRQREEVARKSKEDWLRRVQLLAAEEKVTVKSSRLAAMLPFGVGQLQNGQRALGYTLLVAEGVLVAGTALTLPFYVSAQASAAEDYARGDPERRAQAYKDRAASIRAVNLALAGGFVAVAIAGVVQAQLAFVPERVEVRKRSLPPEPDGAPASAKVGRAPHTVVFPSLAPVEGGGVAGLSGRF